MQAAFTVPELLDRARRPRAAADDRLAQAPKMKLADLLDNVR
jgi:hypothetical protein